MRILALNSLSRYFHPYAIGCRYTTKAGNLNQKLIFHDKYKSYTLEEIVRLSRKLADDLCGSLNRSDLKGEKIAVLCANNYTYLISILGVWMANGVPIGLNKNYPNHLIEYFINDCKCKLVVNGTADEPDDAQTELGALLDKYRVVNYQLMESSFKKTKPGSSGSAADSLSEIRNLLRLEEQKNKEGIILYTSGTSGPPKGVVLTRSNILRTIETLVQSWQISADDSLLHVLPLNHVHGLIYCLLTYIYSGAQVDMLPKFNAELVWSKLLDQSNGINSFMAVPTVYVQLVSAYLKNDSLREKYKKDLVKRVFKEKMRLVVSGSASLNVKTYHEWLDITDYKILERYGMTEIGLGLSNPFVEEAGRKRMAGAVGRPYGNTKVRVVEPNDDLDSKHVLVESDPDRDTIYRKDKDGRLFGELQLKGDMVFREYLNKEKQTKETFSDDGWFKTGDTVEFLPEEKVYKIVGRTSVDVIKSGGHKISALDIERELLANDQIEEVTVMGLSDPVWGQRVFALMILKPGQKEKFDQAEFIKWCKTRLPKYSVPTIVKVVDSIAKNQLGKVNKKELIKKYEQEFKL